MSNADKSLKNWRERLKDKYRLVIMEDETLELLSNFESEASGIEQKISFNEDQLSDPTDEIDAFIVRV